MKSKLAVVAVVYLFLGLVFMGQPRYRPVYSQIMPMGAGGLQNWTLIGGRCDGSTDGAGFTTTAIDFTGADLVIAGIAVDDHPISSFTASNGDTPTLLSGASKVQQTGSDGAQFRYISNPTTSGLNALTFTIVGATTYSSICSLAFKGSKTSSPFDQENGQTVGSGNGTTGTPGSVTPTTNNQLLVSSVAFVTPAASSVTINSSFTKHASIDLAGAQHYGMVIAYLVLPTAAATNPTWSGLSNIDAHPINIATFKGR